MGEETFLIIKYEVLQMPATVENQKVKVSFQNRQAKRATWSLSIHLYPYISCFTAHFPPSYSNFSCL